MRNQFLGVVVESFRDQYRRAGKPQKTRILGEIQRITDVDRKHLIKLLGGKRPLYNEVKRGRPRVYSNEIKDHISKLHKLMEQISPKRMKEAIPLWLPSYERHYGRLSKETRAELLKVSSSTIERILRSLRGTQKGKSSTRAGQFKNKIPLKRLDEKVTFPGTVQADTVAHCGSSLAGDFAYTLTLVDIFTGWTENRASWTKQSSEIKRRLINIEKEMPITMRYFDTDCGSEFLNYRIMRYFENRQRKVKMRRARPYKKNDQCYVEQRNFTHVRNLFGYERLESPLLIEQMNRIYKVWNRLHNFFLPSFKLKEKVRVGAKIKKVFDIPRTPAQRLLESRGYSGYMKRRVRHELSGLDPVALKKELEEELRIFYRMVDNGRRRVAA